MGLSKSFDQGSNPCTPAKFMQSRVRKNPNFSVNDLILFCMRSIILNNEQCSFERLIKECFSFFPETLKFERYPIWPDSRKLDRPLRELRKEKLIIGDPKNYFLLTKEGEKKSAQISKALRQGKLL
jgi:hypothetical protein